LGSGARRYLTLGSGILVILLALHTAFDLIPFLRFEKRVTSGGPDPTGEGLTRPILFGMAFAAGWTPCVGRSFPQYCFIRDKAAPWPVPGFCLRPIRLG
jgi:cytochrome c biogenesis protein CcdA